MKYNHKVKINVSNTDGNKQEVLQSQYKRIPYRLAKLLFGDFCEVLILTPGKSVEGITIEEHKSQTHS